MFCLISNPAFFVQIDCGWGWILATWKQPWINGNAVPPISRKQISNTLRKLINKWTFLRFFFFFQRFGANNKNIQTYFESPNPAVGVGTAKSSKRPAEGPGVAWEADGNQIQGGRDWTAGDAELDCPFVGYSEAVQWKLGEFSDAWLNILWKISFAASFLVVLPEIHVLLAGRV